MNSTTLQQYLNGAWADRQQIDHVVRVVSSTDRGDGPSTEFYIRPQNGDGETLDLVVIGNRVMLPLHADKTLVEDFTHFLAYSNLSASAELLIAFADGRGQAITLMDAIIAVDPLLSATHAALHAHQQEQALEGAPIATITVPPLDGRVPATARSAELRSTDAYLPPVGGDQQLTQIASFQGSTGAPVAKPTPASIEARVADVQFHHWPGSTLITCKVMSHNGHEYTADSKPIDAADFTVERGEAESRKKAVALLWDAAINEYRTSQLAHGSSL